jgi:NADH-quinone oxidoreductase subunit E
LDAHAHGPQTTKDGKFTVEFVECLASCGTAPVMMCNDAFYEGVSHAKKRMRSWGIANELAARHGFEP